MTNVIFVGVGGQGVILASKILMEVAHANGYDIKESEVHGMAQRGGSVDTHVRFGKKVYSPLIAKGSADYIVSFELLESIRKLDYLSPKGTLLVNKLQIKPSTVEVGLSEYPEDVENWIEKNVKNQVIVDTKELLREIGNAKTLNIVMLGLLSNFLEFSEEKWLEAIGKLVKERFLDMNINAFRKGRALYHGQKNGKSYILII